MFKDLSIFLQSEQLVELFFHKVWLKICSWEFNKGATAFLVITFFSKEMLWNAAVNSIMGMCGSKV